MASFLKFIPRIFRPAGMPLQLIFFITSRCNMRCQHCFYLDELNKTHGELTLEEIQKMSRSMGPLLWMSLTGGEPFLRRDIDEIAETFYKNNDLYLLTLSTNGTMHELMKEAVPKMCRKCPNSKVIISVSIDGLEKTHDSIRGMEGSFKKAVAAVELLKSMKKDLPNLHVSTITTINALNQAEMKPLALFLRDELRPDNSTINMLRGGPKSSALGQIDLAHYHEFVDVIKEGWDRGSFQYYDFSVNSVLKRREYRQREIISEIFKRNRYVIPCLAAKISCMMTELGDLYPCEILDKKIGNIRDVNYDFKKLWESKPAEELRRFIKDTNCFCTYECALTTSILFNPKELLKMFFTRRRRLVSS